MSNNDVITGKPLETFVKRALKFGELPNSGLIFKALPLTCIELSNSTLRLEEQYLANRASRVVVLQAAMSLQQAQRFVKVPVAK